jgi:hypothetical protein
MASRGRYEARKDGVAVETILLLGMLAGGGVAGLASRWAPLNGWIALAFPLILPAAGMGLSMTFC